MAIVSAILGAMYVTVCWYLHYFIFVFILLYGWVTGSVGIGGFSIKLSHVRSPSIAGFLAILGALVGLYVSWAFWGTLVQGMTGETYNIGSARRPTFVFLTQPKLQYFLSLLTHPGQILELIKDMGQKEVWNIFGFYPTGTALYLIWGLEAVLFLVFVSAGALDIARRPYSEDHFSWFKKKRLWISRVAIPPDPIMQETIISGVSSGDLSYLTQKNSLASRRGDDYLDVQLYSLEGARNAYISISSVIFVPSKNRRNKHHASRKVLVKYLQIPLEKLEEILSYLGDPYGYQG
jgi:hypothetical protein